jgi:hypothetical protein
MNKKTLGFALVFVFLAALAAPMVLAKPGEEKSNDKFEYFELACSGAANNEFDKFWLTPPNADPLENKTAHARGGGWVTGEVVELTVGDKTFTMTSDPYSVDWTTTYDANIIRNNDGTNKLTIIQLTDIVTLYYGEDVIGTLVLNLKSAIDFSTVPPGYSGTMQGYGTGALEGVHISGLDVGLVDPVNGIFLRTGTITGWPEQITNTS